MGEAPLAEIIGDIYHQHLRTFERSPFCTENRFFKANPLSHIHLSSIYKLELICNFHFPFIIRGEEAFL